MLYLARRGVPSDGMCPGCKKRLESMTHALWGCRVLGRIRDKCSFVHKLVINDGMHFHDFMILILNSIDSSEVELLCVIFWRIWFCRNQLVHKQSDQDLDEVVNWSSVFLEEWRSAQGIGVSKPVLTAGILDQWRPPLAGFWKINTDAAVCSKKAGDWPWHGYSGGVWFC